MSKPRQETRQSARRKRSASLASVSTFQEWIHTLLSYSSYLLNSYNYVFDEEPSNEYVQFLNNIEIQRALHTGRTVFTAFNWMVFIALLNDFPLSVKPWLEELLDNDYGVLSYG